MDKIELTIDNKMLDKIYELGSTLSIKPDLTKAERDAIVIIQGLRKLLVSYSLEPHFKLNLDEFIIKPKKGSHELLTD